MNYFAWAIAEQDRVERAQDGLAAVVHGYYEDYTDAVELDGQTYRALEHLAEWADVNDFDDWLIGTEREVAAALGRHLTAIDRKTSDEADDEEDAGVPA